GIVQGGFGGGQSALGVGAGGGFLVDRFLGGRLGALACVEGAVERLAVIALRDGVVGALERLFRRRELFAGVLVGAGGACRVDRALRLLHFFFGGIAACRAGHRR